jgi:RimJ/RimL family protein N-acetyltransferase
MWIAASHQQIESCLLYQFAIAIRETGNVIGVIALRKSEASSQEAELTYWLGKSYWGCGYMREAAKNLLDWITLTTKVTSVWAGVLPHNSRSVSLMEAIGMQRDNDYRAFLANRAAEVTLRRYRLSLRRTCTT